MSVSFTHVEIYCVPESMVFCPPNHVLKSVHPNFYAAVPNEFRFTSFPYYGRSPFPHYLGSSYTEYSICFSCFTLKVPVSTSARLLVSSFLTTSSSCKLLFLLQYSISTTVDITLYLLNIYSHFRSTNDYRLYYTLTLYSLDSLRYLSLIHI